MIKQAVMCQGDTTLIPVEWAPNGPYWVGNYSTPHQCVNWEGLMDWVRPRAFDANLDGLLVHPKFGSYSYSFILSISRVNRLKGVVRRLHTARE